MRAEGQHLLPHDAEEAQRTLSTGPTLRRPPSHLIEIRLVARIVCIIHRAIRTVLPARLPITLIPPDRRRRIRP